MFQIPVRISTPKAGHATRLKAFAAARGTSAPARRSAGTRAARVIWPPTHTVAASTCRKSRTVSRSTPITQDRSRDVGDDLGRDGDGPRTVDSFDESGVAKDLGGGSEVIHAGGDGVQELSDSGDLHVGDLGAHRHLG